jgi:hypothetical protein
MDRESRFTLAPPGLREKMTAGEDGYSQTMLKSGSGCLVGKSLIAKGPSQVLRLDIWKT